MPGQITHFYLASRMAESFRGKGGIRGEIHDGFKSWLAQNEKFENATKAAIEKDDAGKMQAAVNAYRNSLIASDNVALFSAFNAGAVGPDLWTLPVAKMTTLISEGGPRGAWYFDLGHYNLSHIFPKYTLRQIRSLPDDIQKKYRTAYILGFLSHIALDILTHLKVNVFAGAYHKQQQNQWETEQGNIKEKLNKLNNHNKVEHYLDAFIRFFCFEGFYSGGKHDSTYKKFSAMVRNDFGQSKPWHFPNYSDHYSAIMKFGKVFKTNGITNYPDESFLDLSTSLPAPFAHRYHVTGSKGVKPFIRDYFAKAYAGVVDDWLKSGYSSLSTITSEVNKLEYFNFIDDLGWRDINDEISTQYYYIRTVIPDLDKVVKNTESFYSPGAFGHFIQGSMKVADEFISNAVKYLGSGDESCLEGLDRWNLDTGQAIRLKKGTTAHDHQIPVCLDIECVLDLPCLKGWTIPTLAEIKLSKGKKFPFPKKYVGKSGGTSKYSKFPTGKTYKCFAPGKPFGIQINVRQACFHTGDLDEEIGASIKGDSGNADEPWVIQGKKHSGQKGYDIGKCIEDYQTPGKYSSIVVGKSSGRKSKCFETVFTGELGGDPAAATSADDGKKTENRELPRHIKISTYRKFVNYTTDTGNFSPSKLGRYLSAYPSEEMVFSIFMLEKTGGNYRDLFRKGIVFKQSQVDSLKKIHVIGVNTILIILKVDDDGKTCVVDEAWVDGEKVVVK